MHYTYSGWWYKRATSSNGKYITHSNIFPLWAVVGVVDRR